MLGTWLKLPIMEGVELIALAGFDFVVIDLEHSPINLETAFTLIGVAGAHGVSPIVRVPNIGNGYVQRVLDAGAEGIMVPHVDSVEQARQAVDAVRFPPLGHRGASTTGRAGEWGALPLAEYLRFGNDEVVLIAQIETALGAAASREISAVSGIDALLVGEVDLSVSEGKSTADPSIAAIVSSVVVSAHEVGVPVGNAGGASASAVEYAFKTGFDFTMLSNDASLLGNGAREAVAVARALSRSPVAPPSARERVTAMKTRPETNTSKEHTMDDRILEILDGAMDLHVHPGPSPFPRRIGILQAAEQAASVGFRAILVKSHHHSMLTDIAAIESACGPLPIPVFGGVALNNYVGGLNPVAVELAINRGARIVWFPTISSDQHICAHSDELKFPKSSDALSVGSAIRILDKDGKLVPAAQEVLRLIKDNELILSTGHMSPEEVTAVLTEAHRIGIPRLLVNHPNFVIEANESLVMDWIALGAVIEHSLCMYDDRSTFHNWDIQELARLIAKFGPEHTLFGSDLGQVSNPLPIEGYERIITELLDLGFTTEQLRTITVENPSRLAAV